MKNRIIAYLGDFAKGDFGSLGAEIGHELGMTDEELKEKSAEVLSGILHHYSQFSISTIDAFFQRVIRSFTRESGLLGNFRLEVENDRVLEEVVAEMMDDLGPDHAELTEWVIQFSQNRLVEGESWNISAALIQFAKEIFKENYKAIEDDILRVREKISITGFLGHLQAEKRHFLDTMQKMAQEAVAILQVNGIESADFSYGDIGTAWKYFKQFSARQYVEAKQRVIASAADSSSWAAKLSRRKDKLKQLAETQLRPILAEMLAYDKENYIRYRTADLVETNFYSYGLLLDITRKLKQYKTENNLMLLSDASHFLNGVIAQSDTPFIYEKVGSFYRHYLIDEFQDTSGLQWGNFKPLVRESLDQNNRSIVVGDVKQSIYRWRGSDLGLLQETVELQIGADETQTTSLLENWRSASNIVGFNNAVFSTASRLVSVVANHPLPESAFADVIQKPIMFPGKGLVRIEFIERWKGKEENEGEELALRKIPAMLEELQASGVSPGDITILVRKNGEGQKIADFLMHYKNSDQAVPGVRYEVVSNESLRLDAASSVLLLLSALKFLNNPDDAVARAELIFEAGDQQAELSPAENEFRFSRAGINRMNDLLPEEFAERSSWLVKLSLFELTETLIRIFGLGENTKELNYLQCFQDVVLEFGGKDKNDIAAFLKWWEEIRDERSITVAANTDAVNIYTIHKSKGLQFKYVLVPFCSWNMDHELKPLIWVKSDHSPYDELGYVAVRYTSGLKSSFFENDYLAEFTKAYLDNLNLLYVAFTRAEEGLMIMAPLPGPKKTEGKISNVGQLLYEAIASNDELKKDFDGTHLFSVGTLEVLGMRSQRDSATTVQLRRYASFDWRQRLVIRREGREFFQHQQTDARKKVNYGVLMHSMLARIQHGEDAPEVLQQLEYEGVILQDEREPMLKKINSILGHPEAGSWFDREWNVRTETPVILPLGKIARIDRVISRDVVVKGHTRKKAIIIDYKTGEKTAADRQQVEEYAAVLSSMGYFDVEGYLLYLEKVEVVPVMDKMNLSLGF